ncbi:hypothetical protein HAX54_034955, partial [Datura stramonium]|nr:hypothetical protein [Datura stramonium]
MAPKYNKEKEVASSSHGNKGSRMGQEAPNEDASMQPQPPRRYGLRWHGTHVMSERLCLVYALMIGMPINVDLFIKDVLIRERVNKGQRYNFGGLLTRFLRGHQIDEEVVDCRPYYDPKEIDVTKTKDLESIYGLVLSISERYAHINNVLSHIYG